MSETFASPPITRAQRTQKARKQPPSLLPPSERKQPPTSPSPSPTDAANAGNENPRAPSGTSRPSFSDNARNTHGTGTTHSPHRNPPTGTYARVTRATTVTTANVTTEPATNTAPADQRTRNVNPNPTGDDNTGNNGPSGSGDEEEPIGNPGGDPEGGDDDDDGGDDGGGGGGDPIPAVPHPVPHFALSPAEAHIGTIDYYTRGGQRLFDANTAALPELFDCETENLLTLIQNLSTRANVANWTMTRAIPFNNGYHNLFQAYGILSVPTLRAYAQTYVNVNGRDVQNSAQMYCCLYESLTPEAKHKVHARVSDYTLMRPGNVPFLDGPLFFKAITQTTEVDTLATVNALSTQLTTLAQLMVTKDHNIKEFNLEVNDILDKLLARGAHPDETHLIVNLFAGYTACADPTFGRYIQRIYDDYSDGNRTLSSKALMTLALNKYTLHVDTWLEQSEEQRQLVTLQAEVNALTRRVPQSRRSLSSSLQPTHTTNAAASRPPRSSSAKAKEPNRKKKNKQKDYKPPIWKTTPPANGASESKQVKGKTYHWCGHCINQVSAAKSQPTLPTRPELFNRTSTHYKQPSAKMKTPSDGSAGYSDILLNTCGQFCNFFCLFLCSRSRYCCR